ncbi:MAG: YdcF family protein [Candidatus Peregrinibacteria bacterium]
MRIFFFIGAMGGIVIVSVLLFIISQFNGTTDFQIFTNGGGERCALVFGAAIHKGALPGPAIIRRVETAVRLYREKILEHIVLSGGKGSGEVTSESKVMRDVALKSGIPAGDITIEEQSRTTWENLVYSRSLVASCSQIVGISDRYHLARIRLFSSAMGYSNLSTYPSDAESSPWFESQSTLREALAILYYIPQALLAYAASH